MSAVSSPPTVVPRVSVVLPIYKTARYFRELVQRLKDTLDKASLDFELLMVDDDDPDNAWEIPRDLAAQDPRVKAIKLSRNFGQHPAIAAGFEHTTSDVIILTDADLQDRPEDIPLLLEKLQGDVDAVYTVKMGQPESFSTRLTSRLYHYVFSKFTRTNVPRNMGTFRAFTRRFLEALLSYPERNVLYGPLMLYPGAVRIGKTNSLCARASQERVPWSLPAPPAGGHAAPTALPVRPGAWWNAALPAPGVGHMPQDGEEEGAEVPESWGGVVGDDPVVRREDLLGRSSPAIKILGSSTGKLL